MSSSYSNSRNKPRPNSRSGKIRSSGVKHGSNPQNTRDLGVLNDPILAQIICQIFIGRVVEISTVDEEIQGIFSAMSPSGDVAISKSKNGVSSDELKVIQTSSIKRVVSKDCDELPIKNKFETDAEIAVHAGISRLKMDDDFNFEPYFNISDKLDMQEDSLETEKDGQHWFPPENMFEVNLKQFNVHSSYDDALSSYTIPLDTSQPNYAERSARAEKLAQEIEHSTHSRNAADLENDDGGLDEEDEEKMHSAVIRPSQSQSNNVIGIGRGRQSNSRAEAFKNAFSDKPRNTFSRHGGNQRTEERKYQKQNFPLENEKSKEKLQPVECSSVIKDQTIENDIDNDKLTPPERLESKTPDAISSDASTPICKFDDSVILQSPELSEVTSDKSDLQKKTSLNPDAPEFKPQARTPHVESQPVHTGFQTVPVSYAATPNAQFALQQNHAFTFPVQTMGQQSVIVPGSVANGSKMIRNQMTNVQAISNQPHPPSISSPHQAKYNLQRSVEVTSAQQPLVGSPFMMVQSNNLPCFISQPQKFIPAKPAQPSQHQVSTSVNSSQNFQNQPMSSQNQHQNQQQHIPQHQSHMVAQPTPQMFIQQPGFTHHGFPAQHQMVHMLPNQHQAMHHQPNMLQAQSHAGVSSNNQAAPLYYQYPLCTNGASMTTHAMNPGNISSMPNHQSQYYILPNTVQFRPASLVHQPQMHAMSTASNANFNHSQSAQQMSFMPRQHNQHPNS